MATIDPAGNASAALYTPAAKVEKPTQAVVSTEIERPVEEVSESRPSSTAVTNEVTDQSIGSIIDTRA